MSTNLYNRVTVKDQEYLIKKFDAKTGMKLARLVMAKLEPIIPLLAAGNASEEGPGSIQAVLAILGKLTDDDIDALVDKCLRVCYADLPAGLQPVIDETGHYGVEDVEYDMMLTLTLCYEAIKWGAADFFGENSSLSSLFQK